MPQRRVPTAARCNADPHPRRLHAPPPPGPFAHSPARPPRPGQPGAVEAMLRWYRANHNPAAIASTRVRRGACPPLRVPVLGVWPSGDGVVEESQMAASGAFVADPALWRYERLEGAGHWAQRDAPERLSRLLLGFLGGGGGARPRL